MPNTWAAGMSTWLHRYGMRRETSWRAASVPTTQCAEQRDMTRKSATMKPSIIADVDMAWLLADAAGECLTGHERTITFVELGCQDYLPVIKRILNAVLACRMTLPERVIDALSRWLDGYVGSAEEPELRTLLAEIRERLLEPVAIRAQQPQRGNVRSPATPVH